MQHQALARLTADMQRQLDQLSKAVEGLQRVRGPLACCSVLGLLLRASRPGCGIFLTLWMLQRLILRLDGAS